MIEQKIAILREVFPQFRIRKGCEFVTYCPTGKCQSKGKDKMKLEINLSNDRFACWRCQYSGLALKLLRDFGKKTQRERYASLIGYKSGDEVKQKVELPSEYKFVLDDRKNIIAKKALNWLIENLSISEEVIFQNRIGFCDSGDFKNRIIFPSFDKFGRLNYFTSRSLYDSNIKWLNCAHPSREIIFNELFIRWNQPLILIESVKSYLKHFNEIDGLVCLNGKKINENHALFHEIVLNDVSHVIVAFDAEADKEALKAINLFCEYGINTRFVKLDDKQPDEISSNEFLEFIQNSQSLEKIDILKEKIKHI